MVWLEESVEGEDGAGIKQERSRLVMELIGKLKWNMNCVKRDRSINQELEIAA